MMGSPIEMAGKIFSIQNDLEFEKVALDVFRFQARENPVYREFLELLKVDPVKVDEVNNIPFLPIEFFKSHKVVSTLNPIEARFSSSGTTGSVQSFHYISDRALYEKSYRKAFKLFYGNIEEYCVLALLPSYLEREGSSLIYMVDDLIKKSNNPDSGFYLHNLEELQSKLEVLKVSGKKILLIGVTYALLDLAEQFPIEIPDAIIMETGGMKGKRKELIREELHFILTQAFGVETIHSEYGMTELLSQGYSKGDGLFACPPWMKVLIRDVNDPFSTLENNKTGGINVIDLANIYSCSFIATQDLGKKYDNDAFEVLGRFDNSDIRGCNLLI